MSVRVLSTFEQWDNEFGHRVSEELWDSIEALVAASAKAALEDAMQALVWDDSLDAISYLEHQIVIYTLKDSA